MRRLFFKLFFSDIFLITLLAGKTCLGDLPSVLVHGHLVFLQTVQLVKPFLTARDDALKEKQIFQEV